jgi:hypothetical protein
MSEKSGPPPKDPTSGWLEGVRDRLVEWTNRWVSPPPVLVPVPVRIRRR